MLSISFKYVKTLILGILFTTWISGFAQRWHTVGNGTEGLVYELYADSKDSILYMSGGFEYNDIEATDYVKYWDGTALHRMDSGGTNGAIRDILEYNGDLIFSGHYGPESEVIMGWDSKGWFHLPSPQGQITGLFVETLARYENQLYAFGLVLDIDTLRTGVGVYNGNQWEGFHGMINNSHTTFCNTVHKGKLYVAGGDIRFDTVNYGNAIVYDGTGIQSVAISQDPCVIYVLEVYRDTLYAGTKCGTVYKLDSNKWEPVIQTDDRIIAMKSHDGILYFGGKFDTVMLVSDSSMIEASNIAYYDNTSVHKMGSGMDDYVLTIEYYQGSIYAGGEFTMAGGMNAAYIARWGEPVGIEEIEGPGRIKIYPNPAGNFIYFEFPAPGGSQEMTVTLYNEVGAVVLQRQLSAVNGRGKLDVDVLEKGLYIVDIVTSQSSGHYHGKFVKQ